MPSGEYYTPLHVGASLNNSRFGYETDSSGENISEKNPQFCELTGLFWAYKNIKAKFKGLVHYRRHFTLKNGFISRKNRIHAVLSDEDIEKLIKKYDLILPKPRNYRIETLWDHYVHTLYPEPLEETYKIIEEKYPKYLKEFKRLKIRKSAHMFNIFIARQDLFDEYSKWLFDVLFELENNLKKTPKILIMINFILFFIDAYPNYYLMFGFTPTTQKV